MWMLGFLSCALQAADLHEDINILADSAQKLIGKKQLPELNAQWMKRARALNDAAQVQAAYENLTSHYYDLGDVDSLKKVTYEFMDWCEKNDKPEIRYLHWRQYIYRVIEKGMQEEAVAETARLHEDAEKAKNKYGLACGEMCIGYNHRIFTNNVQLCIECYNNALKLLQEGGHYRDVYVVLLNIIQTYLARSEYAQGEAYLNKLEELEAKMRKEEREIKPVLHLRFAQFRVICMLASKGKAATQPYIKATDDYYRQNPGSSTSEAWYAYKIMCCRVLGDLKGNVAYVDSLMDYQHSIGVCYPYNHIMKAELQEQMGKYRDACRSYARYAAVNDSIRNMKQSELLSKYTAQFEVDRLKMEQLELKAKANKNQLITALIAGCIALLLFLQTSYLYARTLSMNRKMEVAHKAVQKMGQVKNSFIRHITHEIRTPLNSIVGFSTLLAEGNTEEEERKEYVAQVESNNTYLLGLMENILTIADMDSQVLDMPRQEVDVNECCKDCIESLAPVLKEGVAVECVPSQEVTVIHAFRPWLQVALTALLDNAVKFTEKGSIRISCKADKKSRMLRVVVEDTGIGIRPEDADRIFDRFYKLDAFTKGSGLGLAVVREIMEIVGGRVYLDDTYTKGCRFVLEWPL